MHHRATGPRRVAEWYEELELDQLFRLSVDLFCVIDVDGRLCTVSPSFVELLGYTEPELLHRPLEELVHADDVGDTLAHLANVKEGKQHFQTRHKRKEGGWVWLSWTAGRDSQGRIYAIGRDVTSERQARNELAQQALAVEETNGELRQVARVASHDLQEPLRSIASYSEIVEGRYSQQLDDTGREFLKFIGDASLRMLALVGALSEYSRLCGRALELRPVDSNEVVARVLANLSRPIAEADVRVHVESLPVLVADPVLFPVVMHHLVDNAIKFRASASPQIWITGERAATGWRLSVSDNGIGVENRHRERIFEVFKRLHSDSLYDGTGIGLALCRQVVRQHGGNLRCNARPDGGSVFDFTIPKRDGAR